MITAKNALTGRIVFGKPLAEIKVSEIEGGYKITVTDPSGTQELEIMNGVDGKDGYTPQKGIDYFDGKDGVDGQNGRDGYTPVKGVDYFDGKDGKDGQKGRDGYTPVKGVDYFDGKDGKDGKDGFTLPEGLAILTVRME